MQQQDNENSGGQSLFAEILFFMAFQNQHFLDSFPLIQFIDEEDIENLAFEKKEIINKYIQDYERYKHRSVKYIEIFNSGNGLKLISEDESLKNDFLEISKILKKDSQSDFDQSIDGKKILLTLVYSKSLTEILSKMFAQDIESFQEDFKLKKLIFQEDFKQQRLNQLKTNTIIDKEVQKLTEEFNSISGFQIIEKCKIKFEDFLNEIPTFNKSLLRISKVFERDFDFFLNKKEFEVPYTDFDYIIKNLKNKEKEYEDHWKEFVSKNVLKILYIIEFRNYIEEIRNFNKILEIEEAVGYTLKRQIIAIMLLLKEAGLDFNSVDNKKIAHFIRFIIKNGLTHEKIESTVVYKNLAMVDIINDNEDLTFVKEQLSRLNLKNFKK